MIYQQMVIRDTVPVIMVWCRCSCVAEADLCHTVALLFQTAHFSQLDVPVVPPVHNCSESEQQWHKPRTAVSFTAMHGSYKIVHIDECYAIVCTCNSKLKPLFKKFSKI